MPDVLDETAALLAKSKPWFFAEEDSFWLASGNYPGEIGAFRECWVTTIPEHATGGPLLFKLIGPLLHDMPPFGPEYITHAVEYELVPRSIR